MKAIFNVNYSRGAINPELLLMKINAYIAPGK